MTNTSTYPLLMHGKQELIDIAFKDYNIRSFADLGGAAPLKGVQGGYTFHALEKRTAERAFIVDSFVSDPVKDRCSTDARVTLIKDHFHNPYPLSQVHDVDCIFLFDILLHQVKPDWNEILALYSKRTNIFLIYNQQYTASTATVRLLDLGEEQYLHNVPYAKEFPPCKQFLEQTDEIMPGSDRLFRDAIQVWQWGITDHDLIETMRLLGFSLHWFKNYGHYGQLENMEEHGFIFTKDSPTSYDTPLP